MPELSRRFKTQPFKHQLDELVAHWGDQFRAILWEQGTGKSWLATNNAAELFRDGKIDAILVVAPNGVHRNWITQELPAHLPDDVAEKARLFCYRTDRATTNWHREEAEALLKHQGLAVLAMSFDAVTTEPITERDPSTGARRTVWRGGKKYLWDFLSKRRVMYIVDEARRIKNPKADRTKVVVKSGQYAPYRRILNGTPVPNGPFDLYPQIEFLDPTFWKRNGLGSFTTFKTHFGIFQKAQVRDGSGNIRQFDQLLGYRNLDQMSKMLEPIATRVLKEDVLDLPPKIYTRRGFQMESKQAALYAGLSKDFMAMLDSGQTVSAPLAITRMLRLQQIASGYVATDDGEPAVDICKTNPRLDLVLEICEDLPHKAIIWTRFRRTIDLLMASLGKKAVRYDGSTDEDARASAVREFCRGDAQFFVANQQSACEGLTLLGDQDREGFACKTSIIVEHTFDLAVRQQLEDRNHRIGQRHSVEYVDVIAESTIDAHIVKALLSKFDVSCQITGDRLRSWLASG